MTGTNLLKLDIEYTNAEDLMVKLYAIAMDVHRNEQLGYIPVGQVVRNFHE